MKARIQFFIIERLKFWKLWIVYIFLLIFGLVYSSIETINNSSNLNISNLGEALMNYWQFFGPIMIFGLLTQRNTLLSERKEVIIMKKEKLIKKINAEISLMDNSEYEIENDVLLAFYIIKFYNEKNIFTFLNNNLRIQKLVYFAYCMYYAINKKELMRRSKV